MKAKLIIKTAFLMTLLPALSFGQQEKQNLPVNRFFLPAVVEQTSAKDAGNRSSSSLQSQGLLQQAPGPASKNKSLVSGKNIPAFTMQPGKRLIVQQKPDHQEPDTAAKSMEQ
jgi:hypothetical protein